MNASQELKKVELDIFKQFLQVCKNLNLTYYVLGGTLLGAVRHKGFIPWDDDIDVGMPRADYEIFLQKGQELLPDNYFLQTFITDPEFSANFSKIRNSDTTFIETSFRNHNMNHGVYIDIFPLDYFPDNKTVERKMRIKKWFLSGRVAGSFYYEHRLPLKSKTKHLACKLVSPSLEKTLLKREELFKSCSISKRIVNHCGAWGEKEIIPADWYGEGCKLEFEGIRVTAPKEYDKWLAQIYGDYMQLPPVEDRIGHHYADVIDLKKSYIEYRNR